MSNRLIERELWKTLQQEKVVLGEMPDSQASASDSSPVYVRALQGVAGWFAALFLLGFFLTFFQDFVRQEASACILGISLITLAFALLHIRITDFIGQFGLMLSLTGQCLVLFSLHSWLDNAAGWLLFAALEIALAWLMPGVVHCFLTSYAALWALTFASLSSSAVWVMPAVFMWALVHLWLRDERWLKYSNHLHPLAYALTLSVLQIYSLTMLNYEDIRSLVQGRQLTEPLWLTTVNEVLLGGVLVFTIIQLLDRYRVDKHSTAGGVAITMGVILAFASLQATGLAVAWTLMLLGFSNKNRFLLGMGGFAFVGYLGRYYYVLDQTLLEKSYLLIGTGMLLLFMRQCFKWLLPARG